MIGCFLFFGSEGVSFGMLQFYSLKWIDKFFIYINHDHIRILAFIELIVLFVFM